MIVSGNHVGFWFDIINLIIALFGLIGGLPLIWKWITKPNIEISDLKVMRWSKVYGVPVPDDNGNVIGQEDIEANTVISWKVNNNDKFSVFKNDVHDLKTKYNFGKIDLDPYMDYQWSGETKIWPMLGCGHDYPQKIEFEKYCIPDGQYILNLNVMSGNSVIFAYRESLEINETTLRKYRLRKS